MDAGTERYVPGTPDPVAHYEHVHRYLLAARVAAGRSVIDIGSGEGYGSAWLASTARRVVGLEFDPRAARAAAARYARGNLAFATGDARRLPFASESADVVTCFEMVEHVGEPEAVLDEIRRVVRPDGLALISTPNKAVYTDEAGYRNPYHLREYYLEEFEDELRTRFDTCLLLGQRILAGSVMWDLSGKETGFSALAEPVGGGRVVTGALRDLVKPRYVLAVCSREPRDLDVRSLLPSMLVDPAQWLMADLSHHSVGRALGIRARLLRQRLLPDGSRRGAAWRAARSLARRGRRA